MGDGHSGFALIVDSGALLRRVRQIQETQNPCASGSGSGSGTGAARQIGGQCTTTSACSDGRGDGSSVTRQHRGE